MIPRFALVLALLSACRTADRDAASPPPQARPVPDAAPVTRTATDLPAFGLYLLALGWAPSFCCGHANKEQCADLAGSYAATHLTLHGLWPNFNDAEARERKSRTTYPQFCGKFDHCANRHDASCEPDPAAIPAELRELGPGYVTDHDFLARHEWPKHGSCTGLSAADYFASAIAAMKALPDRGTPAALRGAIGGDLPLDELQRAFGVPPASVLLSCDDDCRLQQVSFCLGHDANNRPTGPIACPEVVTGERYDNGCVTRRCTRVAIGAAGACEAKPRAKPKHACNRPGQGPSCENDAACTQQGYLRCAKTGCCTSQP